MPSKKTILIVEDDQALLLALSKGLQEKYAVEPIADGKKAMDWLKSNVPDLVLLDIKLPHVDGITILKSIRKQRATKNVPVIIISNTDDQDIVAQGLVLGAKDYLAKANYSLEDITKMVQERLGEMS